MKLKVVQWELSLVYLFSEHLFFKGLTILNQKLYGIKVVAFRVAPFDWIVFLWDVSFLRYSVHIVACIELPACEPIKKTDTYLYPNKIPSPHLVNFYGLWDSGTYFQEVSVVPNNVLKKFVSWLFMHSRIHLHVDYQLDFDGSKWRHLCWPLPTIEISKKINSERLNSWFRKDNFWVLSDILRISLIENLINTHWSGVEVLSYWPGAYERRRFECDFHKIFICSSENG